MGQSTGSCGDIGFEGAMQERFSFYNKDYYV